VSEYVPAAQKSFRTDVVESVRLVLSRSATTPPINITSHISENNAQHTSPFYTHRFLTFFYFGHIFKRFFYLPNVF